MSFSNKFYVWLFKKKYLCYILLTGQIFCLVGFILDILDNILCIVIAYCDGRNFETNLSFLIKPLSCMIKKVRTKI